MIKLFALALATLLISPNVSANWKLINDESDVNFISTKKSKVSEVHHFKSLDGTINDKGNISINIGLGSVETNIPVRNDRMKSMLFNVTKYSKANINGLIDLNKIKAMKAGSTFMDKVTFKLSLHGLTQQISSNIRIIKLSNNKLMAVSVKPIIISAGKFGLEEGIDKLRKAAKLPSISTAVPVTFSLIFDQ